MINIKFVKNAITLVKIVQNIPIHIHVQVVIYQDIYKITNAFALLIIQVSIFRNQIKKLI